MPSNAASIVPVMSAIDTVCVRIDVIEDAVDNGKEISWLVPDHFIIF